VTRAREKQFAGCRAEEAHRLGRGGVRVREQSGVKPACGRQPAIPRLRSGQAAVQKGRAVYAECLVVASTALDRRSPGEPKDLSVREFREGRMFELKVRKIGKSPGVGR